MLEWRSAGGCIHARFDGRDKRHPGQAFVALARQVLARDQSSNLGRRYRRAASEDDCGRGLWVTPVLYEVEQVAGQSRYLREPSSSGGSLLKRNYAECDGED